MTLRRNLLGVAAALALTMSSIVPAAADPAPPTSPDSETITGVSAVVPKSAVQKISDWQDLQFGLFMHWGVYSMYEGRYEGKVQRIGYPEQIKAWMNISDEAYLADAAKMTAEKWDAAQVCRTAKEAGMKYVMITTKHHDGFAMWDTKTTDFNIVKKTAFGKDPIKQLSEECGRIGIKLAFYFSIIDWTQHEAEPYQNVNQISEEMMNNVIKPQIDELMTNYGPIAEFWFDMGGPTSDQSERMAKWVHDKQPGTVFNSRVWNDKGDFEVGGDNAVPRDFRMGPWESILSIFPQCWSYCSTFKADRSESRIIPTTRTAINGLVTTISGGGQFAFNIGPKGDGSFDTFDQQVLDGIGAWMKRHPDAITGARATWFPIPSWGRITAKGHALYLFPTRWQDGQEIELPGLASRATSVTIDGTGTPLNFTQEGTSLKVNLSGESPDELRPVIKVALDSEPKYLPSNTVELSSGTAEFSGEQIYPRTSPKRSAGAMAFDGYVVDRTTSYEDVTLKISGEFESDNAHNAKYRVTFGDHEVVLTGTELMASEFGDGLTLPANTVTRIRVERADPSYYADPVQIRNLRIRVVAYEKKQETQAPTFHTQPQNNTARDGEEVDFFAGASGRPTPGYQWYKVSAGQQQGQPIDGETSAMLSITAKLADDGASYYAVATNPAGKSTSSWAVLNVKPAFENLALGKASSQSSTAWQGTPERANDGNTDGRWDNASVSHTALQDSPWWQVDLGDQYLINDINVWNRDAQDMCGATVSCSERLKDFWVVISEEDLAGQVDPGTFIGMDGVIAKKVDGIGGYPSSIDFEGAKGRFVRVILPGADRELTLAEVEVFGKSLTTDEAPTIGALEPLSDSHEMETAGDAQSRTVWVPEKAMLLVMLAADQRITGSPEPELQWFLKRGGESQWTAIESANSDVLMLTVDKTYDGASVMLRATNRLGSAESGIIEIHVKSNPPSDPAPDPDPTPNPDPVGPPEVVLDKTTVRQGEVVNITGKGFIAGRTITATIHSTPVTIGNALADADGKVVFAFQIPNDFEVGSHHIELADGQGGISARADLTVNVRQSVQTAPPAKDVQHAPFDTGKNGGKGKSPKTRKGLAATGTNTSDVIVLSGVLMAAGLALTTRRRMRNN
ncbi:alpha-L-fucosidase [Schaalia vaccimaxillae]|uniref:alpha-L-fucosidase n=1 Tax=Schaalia vaccimaxillae TaxID=183916 RepID=UPI000406D631|nr:alpha-L-fucosidase [Schaalia vaccimaxillae]